MSAEDRRRMAVHLLQLRSSLSAIPVGRAFFTVLWTEERGLGVPLRNLSGENVRFFGLHSDLTYLCRRAQ